MLCMKMPVLNKIPHLSVISWLFLFRPSLAGCPSAPSWRQPGVTGNAKSPAALQPAPSVPLGPQQHPTKQPGGWQQGQRLVWDGFVAGRVLPAGIGGDARLGLLLLR